MNWLQRFIEWWKSIWRDLDDCAEAGQGDEFWPAENDYGRK